MPDCFDYVVLGAFSITIIVYLYVISITSRILWHFALRRHKNSIQIVPVLSTLVGSWWLCAVSGMLLAVYSVVLWNPDPIYYNKYVTFAVFLPALVTLNGVHISQFFITLERIIIMKSVNYNQKLLIGVCIIINIGMASFIASIFIVKFATNVANDDNCDEILCMIDMDTYLVSYHISNFISVNNLIASLYFLFLFRKTTTNINASGTQIAKIQNMIKFTICVDICLDILPQMVTVGLSMYDSPVGPYFATFQPVLFSFCGILVNQRFYKVFVVHPSSLFSNQH